MEALSHGDTIRPLDRRYFTGLMATIQNGLKQGSDPLFFDEPGEEDVEVTEPRVGMTREFPAEILSPDETVRVTLYDESGRYTMRAYLKAEHDVGALPLGHIELAKNSGSTSFQAVFYLFENGRSIARLNWGLSDAEDVWSEEAEAGFEFAATIGFGSEWTRFLLASGGEACHQEKIVGVGNNRARQLLKFLNTIQDNV